MSRAEWEHRQAVINQHCEQARASERATTLAAFRKACADAIDADSMGDANAILDDALARL